MNEHSEATIIATRTDGARRWPRGDIRATAAPVLAWGPDECEASLAEVFRHVQHDALEAIGWYAGARRPKRWMAVSTRMFAIVLLAAAGVLPLIDVAFAGFTMSSIWISILVAAGAGALAFDRFHGGSSGWIRYIKSEMRIHDALESFELDWETERAGWGGAPPTPLQVQDMLQRARAFAVAVNQIVQEETEAWADEFQSSIKQIDHALRARAAEAEAREAAASSGALNLVVTNGDQCDDGWDITIDSGPVRVRRAGQTAALRDLPPGIRVIDVIGTIAGKERRGQVAAKVRAGSTIEQKLTLT